MLDRERTHQQMANGGLNILFCLTYSETGLARSLGSSWTLTQSRQEKKAMIAGNGQRPIRDSNSAAAFVTPKGRFKPNLASPTRAVQ
jgi:hypothetical protein